MARTRRSKRYYKKKGRWSANISRIENTNLTALSGEWNGNLTLCSNPVQLQSTVSQQFTVKNIEMWFNFEVAGDTYAKNIEAITAYIMFVPQGMNYQVNDYAEKHPEYIMAMRYFGSPEKEVTEGYIAEGIRNPLRMKTRMARRLQTGDSVILYIQGYNQSNQSIQIKVDGVIRWWTKAN